ncbi:DUF6660 family protein [Sphingobacterium detergens]|uniref:Uncharacterized protein n=1 Tax=Sphingobacterium detergens TaxID=1145106 RepID=A0A420BKR9_SPHD1|nr:hypothetical protein DFQ12_2162 [Sphingobacterium detergens]
MKWIATLLLVVIFALFMVPCGDTSINSSRFGSTENDIVHDHNSNQDDMCTPFCYCSCCGSLALNTQFVPHKYSILPILFFSQRKVKETPSFFTAYLNSIWQPPKFYC